MERVLMLTADSGEELEVYYLLYRFREAGYAVDVAAPQRKRLQLVVHDFEPGADTYVERPGRGLDADLAFSDVDLARYVAVLIPGGRAPEVIRNDPDVKRIVAHFFEHDLPVGHMCHGVQVPAAYGLIRGRKVSAFPPLQPDIEAAGGEFVEGPDVVDGQMVSATGWPDLAEFSRAFLELLGAASRTRAPVPG
jgi:protease I